MTGNRVWIAGAAAALVAFAGGYASGQNADLAAAKRLTSAEMNVETSLAEAQRAAGRGVRSGAAYDTLNHNCDTLARVYLSAPGNPALTRAVIRRTLYLANLGKQPGDQSLEFTRLRLEALQAAQNERIIELLQRRK